MSDAIEVLHCMMNDLKRIGFIHSQTLEHGRLRNQRHREELNALKEALLALEQIEAISLWCNRDKIAQEKYKSVIEILKGNYSLENIKIFSKKEGVEK